MIDRDPPTGPQLEVVDCNEERARKWANASPRQVERAWQQAGQIVSEYGRVGEKIRREIAREKDRREQADRTEGILRRRRVRHALEELGFGVINGGRTD